MYIVLHYEKLTVAHVQFNHMTSIDWCLKIETKLRLFVHIHIYKYFPPLAGLSRDTGKRLVIVKNLNSMTSRFRLLLSLSLVIFQAYMTY
jgi:hypothetical protein